MDKHVEEQRTRNQNDIHQTIKDRNDPGHSNSFSNTNSNNHNKNIEPQNQTRRQRQHHHQQQQLDEITTRNVVTTSTSAYSNSINSIDTKEIFVEKCSTYLLSDTIIQDNSISSLDVAGFFKYRCEVYHIPSCKGKDIDFSALNMKIQLQFLFFICPYSGTSLDIHMECINNQKKRTQMKRDTEGDFGAFIMNEDGSTDREEVEVNVKDFCSKIYKHSTSYLVDYGPPSPSMSPSIISSELSQIKITSNPTSNPTPSPTLSPTFSPTSTITYIIPFTYMIEFYSIQDQQDVVSGQSKLLLDSITKTILEILTSSSRGGTVIKTQNDQLFNYQDQLQHHQQATETPSLHRILDMVLTPFDSRLVKHNLIQSANCTNDASFYHQQPIIPPSTPSLSASHCIIIISEINIQIELGTFTKEEIESYVYIPIKLSMIDDRFQNIMGWNRIVKKVKYLSDGSLLVTKEIPSSSPSLPSMNSSNSEHRYGLSSGWIAAIIITLFFILKHLKERCFSKDEWKSPNRQMDYDQIKQNSLDVEAEHREDLNEIYLNNEGDLLTFD
jgi:hypothetical protein